MKKDLIKIGDRESRAKSWSNRIHARLQLQPSVADPREEVAMTTRTAMMIMRVNSICK